MSAQRGRGRAGAGRAAGIGALGFVGGALLALFVQDLLAAALAGSGGAPGRLLPVFTVLAPVLSVASAVAAVVADRRRAGRADRRGDRDTRRGIPERPRR